MFFSVLLHSVAFVSVLVVVLLLVVIVVAWAQWAAVRGLGRPRSRQLTVQTFLLVPIISSSLTLFLVIFLTVGLKPQVGEGNTDMSLVD